MAIYEAVSLETVTSKPFMAFCADHEAGRLALASGEEVPSLHRPLARLVVDPALLQAATRELEAFTDPANFVDMHCNDQLRGNVAFPCREAPVLQELVIESDRVFREVVAAEVGDAEPLLTTVSMGPYEPRPRDARWHRDFSYRSDLELGAATYTVDLIGQVTTVSTATHWEGDFEQCDLRPSGAPQPEQTHQYDLGTITALDGILGVYRTAGEEYHGKPWLNIRTSVIGALAVPEHLTR